jgi:ATP-binding cassette subfamily B protein
MDEPTAALDPRAEVDVYARMLSAKSDGILVMISHRMGMCRLVDRVLVLSDGQLVESGSHEQLVQTESHYNEMFASQAQWYDA